MTVNVDGQTVTVKGPKGELTHTVVSPITVEQGESGLEVKRPNDERDSRSRHGLTRTLINNMVIGVTEGYEKKLEIVGVGYRVISKGPTQLEFNLGFSHPVVVEAPDGEDMLGWGALRKVGGILTEVVDDERVVVGLGLNVLQAIANQYFTQGIFSGFAIVGIAIIFDRVSQAFGKRLQKQDRKSTRLNSSHT